MEDLQSDPIIPQVDLATTYTARDLNDYSITLNTHDAIFLMKYPYVEKLIDPVTFILFLSSLSENDFDFSLKTDLDRIIDEHHLNCRLLINQKEKEQIEAKLIFKIEFDSLGNYFYIQIMNTSILINYEKIKFKRNKRKINLFLYVFNFNFDYSLTTPYKIVFPKKIFHKLSILFNKKSASAAVNQFTSMMFFRYSPFHAKTITRNKFLRLNPTDDLFDIFLNLSGSLFFVKGKGPFTFKGESIAFFCWIHPYFNNFLNKCYAIELDTTFKVLKPFKTCIPQLIVKNTGVPLGIISGPSESFYLYSMLFESLLILDKTKNLFQKFQKMSYVTDEHSCFGKLETKYNLNIYKCFTHLIRSVGASSALAFLLRDILYCASENEFQKNYLKFCYMLKKLYEISKREKQTDDARFIKVGHTLGIDMNGEAIEKKRSYALLYERIQNKIPTTTNHCESYHSKINSVAGDLRLSLNNRLSLIAHHIIDRLKNLDQSSMANLRNYLRGIRNQASQIVEHNPELLSDFQKPFCSCAKAQYYSSLYDIDLPCIHMILSDQWKNIDVSNFLETISIEDGSSAMSEVLKYYELPDLRPPNEEINEEEESNEFPNECLLKDYKNYEDPIQNMIFHIFIQLRTICDIDEVEVGGIVVKINQELLKEEKNMKIMQENYDEFLAILYSESLCQIYKLKKIFDKF